jgi:RNA polymerase sigma factor for flagellar operon FliA
VQDFIDYALTGDPEVRERLALRHLPLVKFVARKMSTSLPDHIDHDDLVSWGCLGLLDSIDKFDPHRNIKFSTYAVTRIRGAILDGLQQMDWAPKQITSRVRALRRVRETLTVQLSREPSVDEIADVMECRVDEVRAWLVDDRVTRFRSIDGGTEDAESLGDIATASAIQPEQDVAGEVQEIRSRVSLAMQFLTSREQAIFLLYYRDGLTLRQIAEQLGVSVSSATTMHTRMVEMVRGRLAALGGVAS